MLTIGQSAPITLDEVIRLIAGARKSFLLRFLLASCLKVEIFRQTVPDFLAYSTESSGYYPLSALRILSVQLIRLASSLAYRNCQYFGCSRLFVYQNFRFEFLNFFADFLHFCDSQRHIKRSFISPRFALERSLYDEKFDCRELASLSGQIGKQLKKELAWLNGSTIDFRFQSDQSRWNRSLQFTETADSKVSIRNR